MPPNCSILVGFIIPERAVQGITDGNDFADVLKEANSTGLQFARTSMLADVLSPTFLKYLKAGKGIKYADDVVKGTRKAAEGAGKKNF